MQLVVQYLTEAAIRLPSAGDNTHSSVQHPLQFVRYCRWCTGQDGVTVIHSRCSHFTFGNPNKSFQQYFSYKKVAHTRRVPELIPVLGSQPANDVSHKRGGRLTLLSARPAVIPATLKRAATSFAAWWTEAQWVWAVCLRLLPDSVATAIWTLALLRLRPAR